MHHSLPLKRVYAFTTHNGAVRNRIAREVVREFVHFLSIFPLLEADLQRPWQKCLLATDASICFGFGVSVAEAPEVVVRELARAAAATGHYVRLERADRHRQRLLVAHPDGGLRGGTGNNRLLVPHPDGGLCEHPDDKPERPRTGIGHTIGL